MDKMFEHFVYCDTEDPVIVGHPEGVSVAASSLSSDAPDLHYWHERIYPLVTNHPQRTLCYLVPDEPNRDQVALMYRGWEFRNSRRTSFNHVLIGSPENLTPKVAIGSFDWSWTGAIKSRSQLPPDKTLNPITGKDFDSFEIAAESGWAEAAVMIEGRFAELYAFLAEIKNKGDSEGGRWPFGKPGSLLTFGSSNFAILTATEPDHNNAPLPIRLLARLLVMLGIQDDLALSRGIIGSGFSTHEYSYQDPRTNLPRWVFATSETYSNFGNIRPQIILKNRAVTASDRPVAEEFVDYYKKARQKYIAGPSPDAPPEPGPNDIGPVTEEGGDDTPSDPPQPVGPRPSPPKPVQSQGAFASGTDPGHHGPYRESAQALRAARTPASVEPGKLSTLREILSELPDRELLGRITRMRTDELGPIIEEFELRGKPEDQAEQSSGRLVNPAEIRSALFQDKEFQDIEYSCAKKWSHPGDLVVRLYQAVCAFAISDQEPGQVDPEVIYDFLRVLAENYLCLYPDREGNRYSPLALAILTVLYPREGDQREIPGDLASEIAYPLGYERLECLGFHVQSVEPQSDDQPEEPDTTARSFLSTKAEIVSILLVVGFILLFSVIGYVAR